MTDADVAKLLNHISQAHAAAVETFKNLIVLQRQQIDQIVGAVEAHETEITKLRTRLAAFEAAVNGDRIRGELDPARQEA